MDTMGHPTTRRDYALAFKREVVAEALASGASVAVISRRRDINSNLIFTWRKQYRSGTLGPPIALDGAPAFVPGLRRTKRRAASGCAPARAGSRRRAGLVMRR